MPDTYSSFGSFPAADPLLRLDRLLTSFHHLLPIPTTKQDPKDARAVFANMATTVKSDEKTILSLNPLTDVTYGYVRAEMGKKNLAGSVKKYNSHLFLVWKNATEWPKNIEDGPEDTLPKVMSKALSDYKMSLPGKVSECRCI